MNRFLRWLVVLFPLTAFSTETYLGIVSSTTVSPATFTASAGASLSLVCDGPVRYVAGSAASPPTADATSAPLVFGPDNLNVTQRILLPASQDRLSIVGAPTLVPAHRRSGPGVGFACTVYTATPESPVISYTTESLQLYVDPLGSDSSTCTSTGTGACLTLQGAFNKAPKTLRHQLTVSVAAGNYAGVTISGFTIDPAFQRVNAGILLDGTLDNVTPATGTATGTATAGSAGSGLTFGTLTDSAQTWTVNDLRGRLVSILTGTGSGQIKAICSNTATVITICGTWTAPAAASTYAIQAPTSIITSVAAAVPTALAGSAFPAAGIQLFNNKADSIQATTNGFIQIRNMGVNTTGAGVTAAGPQGVNISQSVFVTTTNTTVNAFTTSEVNFSTGSLVATSGGIGVSVTGRGRSLVLNSYINAGLGLVASGPGSSIGSTSNQVWTSTASSAALSSTIGANIAVTSTIIDCGSAASSSGVLIGGLLNNGVSSGSVSTGITVTNCTNSVHAIGGQLWFNSTATLNGASLTYTALSTSGGAIYLGTAVASTSGTADLAVDNGAVTATFASLGAAFGCLPATTGTMSRVCRQ